MNYVRIVLCSLVTWLCLWITLGNLKQAFGFLASSVEVSGILNIWAGFGGFIVSVYLILYSIKDEFVLSLPIGEINRVIIISALVISPLLTVITYERIHSNLNGYVECSDLRTLSSRYSSRTYATSFELCSQLVNKKNT
ncbi:TPA: hypothetical protein ACGG77_003306 [Vibrio cholerae]